MSSKLFFALSLSYILSTAIVVPGSQAAPYRPSTDGEVLERLPIRPNDPSMREIRQLRAILARNPANPEAAVQLAQAYFSQAQAHGDPRYVGYAQAALKPWWDQTRPPVATLVMRATLRQYRHDFTGALADLDAALGSDPGDAQAWSLRSVINVVQARYAEARRDCRRMAPRVSELTATGCVAFIDGLTGRARESHDRLQRALADAPRTSAEQRLWVLVRLAEMAWRLNDPGQAEAHFRQALALDLTDGFLLAAYADFLLDHGRDAEVVRLLKDRGAADASLLRLALAQHRLGVADAQASIAALSARYAAARLRGDTTHEQEESRFTLSILRRPEQALVLAQSNWRVQREPRDARVLLEAAVAARQPLAARPVLDWMNESGIEDSYLKTMAERVAALQKSIR